MTDDLDYAALDPGIRRTVAFLRSRGFDTTDSGDGVSKPADDEDVLPFPHVVMLPARRGSVESMEICALNLMVQLRGIGLAVEPGMVQASYDPVDGSTVVLLMGVDDAMLPANVGVIR